MIPFFSARPSIFRGSTAEETQHGLAGEQFESLHAPNSDETQSSGNSVVREHRDSEAIGDTGVMLRG